MNRFSLISQGNERSDYYGKVINIHLRNARPSGYVDGNDKIRVFSPNLLLDFCLVNIGALHLPHVRSKNEQFRLKTKNNFR